MKSNQNQSDDRNSDLSVSSGSNPACEAIEFALSGCDDPIAFLRCWNEGDFDSIRDEWPEAPEGVFAGADPLHDLNK